MWDKKEYMKEYMKKYNEKRQKQINWKQQTPQEQLDNMWLFAQSILNE